MWDNEEKIDKSVNSHESVIVWYDMIWHDMVWYGMVWYRYDEVTELGQNIRSKRVRWTISVL